MTLPDAQPDLRVLLEEGVTSAWCDIVIGCMAGLDPQRAATFRDQFYDWQRRARAAIANCSEPDANEALAKAQRVGDLIVSRRDLTAMMDKADQAEAAMEALGPFAALAEKLDIEFDGPNWDAHDIVLFANHEVGDYRRAREVRSQLRERI